MYLVSLNFPKMNYSTKQLTSLVLLRLAIGWHFAYEGLTKIFTPGWNSSFYLRDSQGWFSGFFNSLADNTAAMKFVDFANEWGLTLVGLALICGAFSRIASYFGIALLALYYMSHPAFLGANYLMTMEGNYLFIDKNVVEALALLVLAFFPTSTIIGLDRRLKKYLPKLV